MPRRRHGSPATRNNAEGVRSNGDSYCARRTACSQLYICRTSTIFSAVLPQESKSSSWLHSWRSRSSHATTLTESTAACSRRSLRATAMPGSSSSSKYRYTR
eukprot:6562028-Prymnesium_polylepis.1